MAEIKEPIRIRRKKLTNGNVSLYLDIYLNGKRSYEYLKLYLIPETNRKDKEKNRQTLQLAEATETTDEVDALVRAEVCDVQNLVKDKTA